MDWTNPITQLCRGSGPAQLLALVLLASSAGVATAQSQMVFVNGQRLSDTQIAELARANCSEIPNGAYWLNMQTGAWGYAGNAQVQGVIGDGCRRTGGGGGGGGGGQVQYGPYATMDRAQQVANEFRAQGLEAVAYHSSDAYYVNVKR